MGLNVELNFIYVDLLLERYSGDGYDLFALIITRRSM